MKVNESAFTTERKEADRLRYSICNAGFSTHTEEAVNNGKQGWRVWKLVKKEKRG